MQNRNLSGDQFAYRAGGHQPPDTEYGAPMHDIENMMPDYYKMPRVYRSYNDFDGESESVIMNSRGKPDTPTTVYRAVPKGVKDINPGDWVTTSPSYAKQHLTGALDGKGEILSRPATAGELYSEGNSIHEWGWHPRTP
jgi:hypothetical protein